MGTARGDSQRRASPRSLKWGFELSRSRPAPRPSCPIDALIWNRIEEKMEETCPDGDESRADFIDRLQSCATMLPRAFVQRSIARTRECIEAIIDAGGYHPKND